MTEIVIKDVKKISSPKQKHKKNDNYSKYLNNKRISVKHKSKNSKNSKKKKNSYKRYQ